MRKESMQFARDVLAEFPNNPVEIESDIEKPVYKRLTDTEAEIKMAERGIDLAKLKEIAKEFYNQQTDEMIERSGERKCVFMVSDLARLLIELENELAQYDMIISDDASGRLPSMFFRRIINKKRQEAGLPEVDTFFVAGGRHGWDEIKAEMVDFFKSKGKSHGRTLLVTEYIESGRSINEIVKLLEAAGIDFDLASVSVASQDSISKSKKEEKKFIDHLRYGGINDGGLYFYGHAGVGVVKDQRKNYNSKQIHPVKKTTVSQEEINVSRKNMNFLADSLYPLAEEK